jgi:hypothetical protein
VTAIEGAGDAVGVVISREYGLVRATTQDQRSVSGVSFESVLAKLAPEAPADKVRAAAEVLEGILGVGE